VEGLGNDTIEKSPFGFLGEVSFRRLDRDVAEQKLDLIQLPTGKMAEPRAAPPQIMRREFLDSGTCGRGSDNLPQRAFFSEPEA
jgi:hypothetical protein